MVVPSGVISACTGIRSISFNQCYDCFAMGTDFGFAIYRACPFKQVLVRRIRFSPNMKA